MSKNLNLFFTETNNQDNRDESNFKKLGNGLVKKAEQVVMAREQGELDLVDKKIWNYLFHRVYRKITLENETVHQIPVADVINFLNNSMSLKRLKDSLSRLASVEILIDYVDENEVKTFGQAHYLSYSMTMIENGVINFAFDPFLLNFLNHPKVFATLSLSHVRRFQSNYAAKLYEIMSLHVNRYHPYWNPSLEEFREVMNLKNSYPRFDNLKLVIEQSIDEINEIAPFNVIMDEPIRSGQGGKITALNFHARTKGPGALLDIVPFSDFKKNKKATVRDPNTIDLLSGITDAERALTNVTTQAKKSALELLGSDRSIDDYLEQWSQAMTGRKIIDADRSFLSWLDITIDTENENKAISDVHGDTFTMMLEQWESKTK